MADAHTPTASTVLGGAWTVFPGTCRGVTMSSPKGALLPAAKPAEFRRRARGTAPQCERPNGGALRSAAELRRFAKQSSSPNWGVYRTSSSQTT